MSITVLFQEVRTHQFIKIDKEISCFTVHKSRFMLSTLSFINTVYEKLSDQVYYRCRSESLNDVFTQHSEILESPLVHFIHEFISQLSEFLSRKTGVLSFTRNIERTHHHQKDQQLNEKERNPRRGRACSHSVCVMLKQRQFEIQK